MMTADEQSIVNLKLADVLAVLILHSLEFLEQNFESNDLRGSGNL